MQTSFDTERCVGKVVWTHNGVAKEVRRIVLDGRVVYDNSGSWVTGWWNAYGSKSDSLTALFAQGATATATRASGTQTGTDLDISDTTAVTSLVITLPTGAVIHGRYEQYCGNDYDYEDTWWFAWHSDAPAASAYKITFTIESDGYCWGTVSDSLMGLVYEQGKYSNYRTTYETFFLTKRITLAEPYIDYHGSISYAWNTSSLRVQLPNGTWIDGIEQYDDDNEQSGAWHFPMSGTYAQPMRVRVVHA